MMRARPRIVKGEFASRAWFLIDEGDAGKMGNRMSDRSRTKTRSRAAKKVEGKNQAAVALGRLGASKGGHARANAMTAKERSESARRAALSRWQRRDA